MYEGINPITGKERRRWYRAGTTRKAAEKLLGELVKRVHDGEYRAPERITLGDYLTERWLPTKKAQLRPSTFASYRNNVDLHIKPRIGHIPIQRLQPEDLDTFYSALLTDGKRNGAGGGLAPKTVRYIHGIVRKALADAHRKGTVTRNVADLADPPKVGVYSPAMRVWSAEELRAFLAIIEGTEWYPAIFLSANTGMRRGEVLGLPWRHVDLDRATLVVDQQILSVEYESVMGDVKTSTSRRTIDLDPRTIAALRAWRKTQLEQQISSGRRDGEGLVFTRPDGDPIHPDAFSQSFERLVRDSGLRRIRLHDLRHTHATILLKAGVPVKVVSERLGHSNSAFTISVYQHVLPGMQADAAAAFSAAVFDS